MFPETREYIPEGWNLEFQNNSDAKPTHLSSNKTDLFSIFEVPARGYQDDGPKLETAHKVQQKSCDEDRVIETGKIENRNK